MICKSCSRKLPDDSKFCQYCGKKIQSMRKTEKYNCSTEKQTEKKYDLIENQEELEQSPTNISTKLTVSPFLSPSMPDDDKKSIYGPTISVQQAAPNKHCQKCGNRITDSQVYCSCCGKKQTNQKGKKRIKEAITIACIMITALAIVLVVGFGLYVIIYQQKSYDLTTTISELGSGDCYVYSITDSTGESVTDIFYTENQYYIRLTFKESTVAILEKGIYEKNGNRMLMKDENGNITKRISLNGCLFDEQCMYSGNVPAKKLFSQDFKNNEPGANEIVSFNDDATYRITSDTSQYSGEYIRYGCIIKGVSSDINGSRNWVVYNNKLIERCFIAADVYDSEYTERTKYEFIEYLRAVAPEQVDMGHIIFARLYEKEHPITLNQHE